MRTRRRRVKFAKRHHAPHRQYDSLPWYRQLLSLFGRAGSAIMRFFSRVGIAFASLFSSLRKKTHASSHTVGEQPKKRAFLNWGSLKASLSPTDYVVGGVVLASALFCGWALLFSDTSVALTFADNGQSVSLLTKQKTAQDLLETMNVTLSDNDSLNVAADAKLGEGMTVEVERAFPVIVSSAGTSEVMYTQGGTVGDLLTDLNIVCDIDDELTPRPYEDLSPAMYIEHVNVETEYETDTVVIEHKKKTIKDSSMYVGNSKLQTEGSDGEKKVTRRLVYKNGELAAKEVIDQVILKEAVDEVTLVGSKIRYQTSLQGDDRVWKPKPTDSQIAEVMTMEVTAYTHTGKKTATGTWPKIGTIAVNPNIIPYGTKIYVPGYGYGVARDTGAFRHYEGGKKMQIDIFMNTEKECRRWGRKRNVKIYILK